MNQFGNAVAGAVNFDATQLAAGKNQFRKRRQASRTKVAAPRLVRPAAKTCANFNADASHVIRVCGAGVDFRQIGVC